jgi:hypothetical protein
MPTYAKEYMSESVRCSGLLLLLHNVHVLWGRVLDTLSENDSSAVKKPAQ